jgi:hypothetical protein
MLFEKGKRRKGAKGVGGEFVQSTLYVPMAIS